MFLGAKSGKKIVSVLAAISAFMVIQTVSGLSADASPLETADGAPSVSCESSAPASGTGSSSYGTGVVNADYLNVRSSRSTGSSVVGVLKGGSTVALLEKNGGWYKVKVGAKTGWISADYVKATVKSSNSTTTATTKTTAKTTTKAASSASSNLGSCTVTANYLNVRSGPGKNYSLVCVLTKGKSVNALEKKNSWVKIKLSDSKTGWVMSNYVKFASSSAKSTTTTTKKAATTTKKSSNNSSGSSSSSSTGKITVTADVLNARASASTSGKKVGTVRRNEVYAYTAVKNDWYKITIPSGATAYVSGDYVKQFSSYAVKGGGSYLWPVQAYSRISSRFGPRDGRNHYGLDIAAPGGSQIMAVSSGKVIKNSFDADGFGYFVVVQQSDGICAYYAHMQAKSFVKVGASVKAGDTIGLVGTTGHSTGNHLHLEFRKGITRINPINYYPNMK